MSTSTMCQECGAPIIAGPNGRRICSGCGRTAVVSRKLCTDCGADIGQSKRIKDASGNYFCPECWGQRQSQGKSQSIAVRSPGNEELQDADDLIPIADQAASVCLSAKTTVSPRANIVGHDHQAKPGGRSPLPDYLQQIARWERRLLWWGILLPLSPGLLGVFNIFPKPINEIASLGLFGLMLGIVLAIPMQIYLAYRLARAMDKNALVWCIGTLIPYAGMLVLLILNMQATGALKSAGLKAPLFRPWRRA